MSDFLENLNKNAKTEDEVAIEQKQAADRRKMMEEKEYQQLRNNFDTTMKQFLEEIKELCIKAVSDACYITYNGTRYLVCSIALMWSKTDSRHYEGCYDYDVWLQFNCYKLEKNHIISSKRIHTTKEIRKKFTYLKSSNMLSELNCQRSFRNKYHAPEYVNLASDVQNNLDGYTDIHVLPTKIVTANFPPEKPQGKFEFTKPLAKHDFLIKF